MLYRQRTFAEKFSATFEWLGENWKPFFKFLTLLLLPLCLLQGLGQHSLTSLVTVGADGTPAMSTSDWVTAGLTYVAVLVGGFLCNSYLFALVKLSFFDRRDLHSLTFAELWAAMKANMGRLFGGGIFLTFVFVAFALLFGLLAAAIGTVAGGILLAAAVALVFALLPFFPIFLLTDEPLLEALAHSLRLGFRCWWGFFSVTVVMGILACVLQLFGAVPFYLVLALKPLLFSQATGGTLFAVNAVGYLSTVLMLFVSYATSVLGVVVVCVQYGHAAEKVDGVSREEGVNLSE